LKAQYPVGSPAHVAIPSYSPNKQRAASGRRRSQARRTGAAAQPAAGRRHGYWLALPAGR